VGERRGPVGGNPQYADLAAVRSPAGRIGRLDDLAFWVLALVDPAASWTTSLTIVAHGGSGLT
jgi:C-7 ketoreductase